MPNQYKNKVVYNGTTLIDLTSDTVTPATLMQGYTAHDASGAVITGTATGGGSVSQDGEGYIILPEQGGGSSITVDALSVTENGTYTAPTGHAYSPVTVNVSGGGGDSWSWMGKNPVKVMTMPAEHSTFRDNGFDTVSYSTSQTTVRNAAAYELTTACDLTAYDYIQVLKLRITHEYIAGFIKKSASNIFALCQISRVVGVCGNNYDGISAIAARTPNYAQTESSNWYFWSYYNSTGSLTSYTTCYGFNVSSGRTPAVSSYTTASPTATWYKPTIYFRGGTGFISSEAFGSLDFDGSCLDIVCEIWRVDAGTSSGVSTGNLLMADVYNDGLVTS